jgi:hypothetical protein
MWGNWECPNCGSKWIGSMGWDWILLEPENKDKLDRLLITGCGCKKIEDPVYPTMSASSMNFVESDKRKELCGGGQQNDDL